MGFTQKVCTECGDEILYDYTTRSGHRGETWSTISEPTCKTAGVEGLICLACNEVYETRNTAKLGHVSGAWVDEKLATCKESGTQKLTCKSCNEALEYKTTPIQDHKAGSWAVTKLATCKESGQETKYCITCDKVMETRAVSVVNHTLGEWITVKTPTCKEAGAKQQSCTVCQEIINTQELSITENHEFSSYITPPTEAEDGYTTYICGVCNLEKKGNFISYNGELSPSEIYQKISNSLVRVDAYDKNGVRYGLGTGWFIGNEGQLVTNYHVIKGAYSLKVERYSNGATYEVTHVLGYNVTNDVAVIKINLNNTPSLQISTSPVKTGEVVYALGNPKGINDIFSSGIISNDSLYATGKECIGFTAPISPGSSGGPLVNTKGQVIGINTLTVVDSQNINLAVKAKYIEALNLSSPVTPSKLYEQKLTENAYDIFASYIISNATITTENQYMITDSFDGGEGKSSFDYYYIYDTDADTAILRLDLIKKEKILYSLDIYMDAVSNKYTIGLYDYKAGQWTIEAVVDVTTKITGDCANDFDKLFDVSTFRYTEEDEISATNMKEVFYIVFRALRENLITTLEASGTDLTIKHFNFSE